MKKIILFTVLIFVFCIPAIYAAGISLTFDNSTSILTLAYQPEQYQNKPYTLVIMKAEQNVSDINNDNFKTDVAFTYQGTFGSEGELKIKALWENLSTYKVLLNNQEFENNTFFYITHEEEIKITQFIKGLGAQNFQAMLEDTTLLYENKPLNEYLKLDLTNYSLLSDKSYINNQMISTNLTSIKEIKTFFERITNEAYAIQQLKNADKANIHQILTTNTIFSNLDLSSRFGYDYIYKLGGDVLSEFYTTLQAADSLEDLTNIFNQKICEVVINAADWTVLEDALIFHSKTLNLDMSKYNQLSKSDKVAIMQELEKITFISLESIKQEFDSIVLGYPKVTYGGGGGSSGGTSGGGSGIVMSAQIPETEDLVQPPKAFFKDVSNSFWAYDSIKHLYEKKIINGYSDNTFRPESNVTRAEFMKILITSSSLVVQNSKTSFTDMQENEWYYPFVASGVQLELISGYPDNTFGSGKFITREEMATVLFKTANLLNIDIPEKNIDFSDASDISDYATQPMLKMSGLLNGYPDGSFKPKNPVTRSEVCAVIYKLINGGQ